MVVVGGRLCRSFSVHHCDCGAPRGTVQTMTVAARDGIYFFCQVLQCKRSCSIFTRQSNRHLWGFPCSISLVFTERKDIVIPMSTPTTLLQRWSSLAAPYWSHSHILRYTELSSPQTHDVDSKCGRCSCSCSNEDCSSIRIRNLRHHEQESLRTSKIRGLSNARTARFHVARFKFGHLHVCFSLSNQRSSTDPSTSDEGHSRMITAGEEEQSDDSSSTEESTPVIPENDSLGNGDHDFVGLGDFSLLQTRRFWLGTSVAIAVVLGGNLAGVTSSILNTNPETSRSIRADLLFPVRGFKRCFETSHGFEFIYPASWVGDQRLLYRAAERAERERLFELLPAAGQRSSPRRTSPNDPIVAFGPPGTDGELNVSVVVAPVNPNFTLQRIGGPRQAGELILEQFIAPEGSRKVATLLSAEQRTDDGHLYYTLEYSVKGSTFFRHNLSVYTSKAGSLYSLNAQSAEASWKGVQDDFAEIVKSFKLLT